MYCVVCGLVSDDWIFLVVVNTFEGIILFCY